LFIDLLSSRVNDLLKLSERYRIGRLSWPIVSTIGLSGFHIIVLTLVFIELGLCLGFIQFGFFIDVIHDSVKSN